MEDVRFLLKALRHGERGTESGREGGGSLGVELASQGRRREQRSAGQELRGLPLTGSKLTWSPPECYHEQHPLPPPG